MISALKTIRQSDRFHRSSALSTLLRMVCTLVPSSFVAIYYVQDVLIRVILLIFDAGLIGYFVFCHDFLRRKDINRLHTEDYLYARERLDIIAKQGEAPKSISGLDSIESPKRLLGGEK